MRSLAGPLLILCLFSAGCGLIMIGDPVEEMDVTSQDEQQENLKAIRAMLTNQAKPPDTSSEPLPSNEPKPVPETPSQLSPVTPSSSSAPNPGAPAKLPWTPPTVSKSSSPDRSVPAYTTPAPVGPDYSGSIRCAPDGMGGQRCLGR